MSAVADEHPIPLVGRMYELALSATWRVGRKVGRMIYAQILSEPSDGDVLIGVLDTPELAALAVMAHNQYLLERPDKRDYLS